MKTEKTTTGQKIINVRCLHKLMYKRTTWKTTKTEKVSWERTNVKAKS